MIKQIQTILLCAFVFCLLGNVSLAQDKKSSKKVNKENVAPAASNPLEGMAPTVSSDDKPRRRDKGVVYSFIVMINPQDEQAHELWKLLPAKFTDTQIFTSGANSEARFIYSKNPELALFKRAYGSYFPIFSKEDIEVYKAALPCLGEMESEFIAMAEKVQGQ
jgi:hypothetical protein